MRDLILKITYSVFRLKFLSHLKHSLKKIYYEFVRLNYRRILKKKQQQEKIEIAFLFVLDNIQIYRKIIEYLKTNPKYSISIYVCPYTSRTDKIMKEQMVVTYESLKKKGFAPIPTYDEQTGRWLNIKRYKRPDIVFFTNPHTLTKKKYQVSNFLNSLTFYVPYGYMIANIQQLQFNQPFHNLLFKAFYESNLHVQMALKYALNKGKNVINTGYPLCDKFLEKEYIPTDNWKIKNKAVKRIIWAPHHSIENNSKQLGYSNFKTYYQIIIDILKNYSDKIQIAFKPHPLLKSRLYLESDWGKEKTDNYYQLWDSLENGQLADGDYIDLFLTSDAMIFDSISFIAEYIYTSKPGLFMIRDESVFKKFNEFGVNAFNLLYHSTNQNELIDFVENVVLMGKDSKKEERMLFFDKYLIQNENVDASTLIYNYINTLMTNNTERK